MILKNASLMATVGGALAVGALMFAGPAAAHTGGSHVGAQAGGGIHAVSSFAPAGDSASKIGMELPVAPVGTAGSGRVQMTPLG